MEHDFLDSLRMSQRKAYIKLTELIDLTCQLAQAVDRRDEVSTKMLIGMRQQPLLDLQEIEESVRRSVMSQEEEDAIRLDALLHGKKPKGEPETEDETALRELCEKNRRQLDKIVQLDRRISVGMGGKRSFYNNFR